MKKKSYKYRKQCKSHHFISDYNNPQKCFIYLFIPSGIMDPDIKKQLVKSVKNIKNKLKQMREEEEDLEQKRRKILKPITDPLEAMVALNNTYQHVKLRKENSNECNEITNDNSSLSDESLNDDEFKTPTKSENNVVELLQKDNIDKALNIAFGVRSEGGKLLIGNVPIAIKSSDSSTEMSSITLNNKTYELTPGLSELLFENKPNITKICEKDKLTYKDILIHTNAHKRGYIQSGQIQGNSGMKYCKIIRPLFFETDSLKQGGNLPTLKKYNSNTDLVYWDDPNELIDRLKVLIASKDAGNTNHDNEIISILEELKEASVIKE